MEILGPSVHYPQKNVDPHSLLNQQFGPLMWVWCTLSYVCLIEWEFWSESGELGPQSPENFAVMASIYLSTSTDQQPFLFNLLVPNKIVINIYRHRQTHTLAHTHEKNK